MRLTSFFYTVVLLLFVSPFRVAGQSASPLAILPPARQETSLATVNFAHRDSVDGITKTSGEELKSNMAVSINSLLEETAGESDRRNHEKFYRMLRRIKIREAIQQAHADKSIYLSLANLYSRLKLYPLAMKCYLKTLPVLDAHSAKIIYKASPDQITKAGPDTLQDINLAATCTSLDLTSADDSLYDAKSADLEHHSNERKQFAIKGQAIINAFNDRKKAVTYALLLQVKQPVPGKRKIFRGANAGHTFITLIKYNSDSSFVSRSFGFYPNKETLFSGTPFCPTTASVFKIDDGHNWDELAGIFISKHKFEKILRLIPQFEVTEYQLSNNNCSDFALQAAALAGIYINDTTGKWPFGQGHNPAVIGQSLLAGKVTGTGSSLYIYNNVKVPRAE